MACTAWRTNRGSRPEERARRCLPRLLATARPAATPARTIRGGAADSQGGGLVLEWRHRDGDDRRRLHALRAGAAMAVPRNRKGGGVAL